ncbi:MAG: MurR/RpiR family transcriptional regulator [Spirochaetaceae bacterium]
MSTQGVYSRIQMHYPTMSAAEKSIANYLLQDSAAPQLVSISRLATHAGASESTIVRFCRKLGYTGYPEFKQTLLSELLSKSDGGPAAPTYDGLFAGDDLSDIRDKLFALFQSSLEDTLNTLDTEALEVACRKIMTAKRVNLFGNNESGSIAEAVVHRFLLLGVDVVAHTQHTLHTLYASNLSADDTCIIVSHSGTNEHLVEAQRIALDNGCHTIAITSNPNSPLAKSANTHLRTSLPFTRIGDEAGLIRVTQIAVLDCLALAVAHYKAHK